LFPSWMELNLKAPSHLLENLQNMCIICDKTACRISINMYITEKNCEFMTS
jgi:hypothetical protein